MEEDLPETIHDIETPCFLVDLDIVESNCQRMIDRCQEMGVELRPHMKTHKTIEGAVLMTNGTKKKMVVSTIAEAQFYAENGFGDILLGKPLVKETLSKRVIQLAEARADFQVMVDSMSGVEALIQTPLSSGTKWLAWLEVDCGYGRTGCRWDSVDAITIASCLSTNENIEFQGLYVHCGNTYQEDPVQKESLQSDTLTRLIELKDKLNVDGVDCKRFGCGSTPSCSRPIPKMSGLTEFHPGNYIFYDYMQVIVGSCTMEDIACKVATTILSHKPEVQTLVVDCGWTAIGLDGITEPFNMPLGMAPVQDNPNLKMAGMTQELGKLKTISGEIDYSKYPLGTRLYLLPWHDVPPIWARHVARDLAANSADPDQTALNRSLLIWIYNICQRQTCSCQTASLHKVYYMHRGDKVVGTWRPVSGW